MKRMLMPSFLFTLLLSLGLPLLAGEAPRRLALALDVDLPLEEVWNLWATEEGLESFFAPKAIIEPRVGGRFEILFSPDSAPGERGAEDLEILAFEPPRRLMFTWSAPPSMPDIRVQRSVVEIRLEPLGAKRTRLHFSHFAWGSGEGWDQAYDYFDEAWRGHVLPHFIYRVERGPLDWSRPPGELPPVAATLKSEARGSSTR